MKTATVTFTATAPYSQSRSYEQEVERLPRETPADFETRTWRNKCHTLEDGSIYIPPMAFKMGLDKAASMMGMQISGRGKATYTKFFLSGVLVIEPLVLPVKKNDVAMDRVYCNADGKRGSGKRVWRNFPRIDKWSGQVVYNVLADEITPEVFVKHLEQAGAFVGIGRFRPESGGYYGRYEIKSIKWN